MLLTRTSDASNGSPSSLVSSLARGVRPRHADDGPARLPAPLRPRRRRRPRGLAAHAGEEGPGRRRPQGRRRREQDRRQAHRLHPLLGRLRGRRGGRERRLGAPGAGVRFADQPRRALRQGRGAARARPRRIPPEVPDEAGQRQVPAHQLGPGARTRSAPRCSSCARRAAPIRSSASARRKHNNEQSYLLRKWVSLWGSNNCDHQARICHSTTVAGVANTWGYGAMTNSYNDMQNSQVRAVHRLATPPRRIRSRCCTCCMPRKPAAR